MVIANMTARPLLLFGAIAGLAAMVFARLGIAARALPATPADPEAAPGVVDPQAAPAAGSQVPALEGAR